MIESFEVFLENFKITDGTITIKDLRDIISLDEGFEYFLNVDGEVSPVSREDFLRYSMSKTSLPTDTNKRFSIDMKGSEIVGSFNDVDSVEVADNIENIESEVTTNTVDSAL